MPQLPPGFVLEQQAPSVPPGFVLESPESTATQDGGMMQAIDDRVRAVARGVPGIGPYTDEISAGLNTGFGYLGDYDKALAAERARDLAYDEAHPVESPVMRGVGTVGGAVAALPALGAALPSSLAGQAALGSTAGAVLGGVEGFGRGEGDVTSRVQQAGTDAMLGGAVGAVAPFAARGVGQAAKWGMKGWQRLAQKMGVGRMTAPERKAATRILQDMEASGMSVDDAAARLDELGPEGMLADISPTMQQRTGQISANNPTASRTITGALKQRREAGGGRVRGALDATFGRAKDPYVVNKAVKDTSALLAPEYSAAHRAPFDSRPVINELVRRINQARGPLRAQLNRVLKMFGAPGGSTGMEAHQIREVLDDMTDNIFSGQSLSSMGSRAGRQIGDFRKALDAEMKRQIPEFRNADRVFADVKGKQNAFNYGREEMFRGGRSTPSPGQVADKLRTMSGPERQFARQGARFDIERQLSNQRRNPALSAESALTRDFNDQKARLLVGRRPASELGKQLEREKTFLDTSNLAEAGRGSRTAMLQQPQSAAKDMTDIAMATGAGGFAAGPYGAAGGFAAGITKRLAERGQSALAQRAERAINQAQAAMLTASGPERAQAVQNLSRLAADMRRAGATQEAGELLGFALTVQQGHRAEPVVNRVGQTIGQ